ncbi:MAG: cyclodeaminase/cyclohydrolase family protein [Elusimicrobiota bacterium]
MNKLVSETLNDYLNDISSSSTVLGSGNAVGVVLSIACALMLKALRKGVFKKGGNAENFAGLENNIMELEKKALSLAVYSTNRFKEIDSLNSAGGELLEKALEKSAEVSLEVSSVCLDIIRLLNVDDLEKYREVATDLGMCFEITEACFNSGLMNYKADIKRLKNQVVFNRLEKIKRSLIDGFNVSYGDLIEYVRKMV